MESGRGFRRWSQTEIVALLDAIRETDGSQRLLGSLNRPNSNLYNLISEKLIAQEYRRTAEQCRRRFKAMKAQFMRVRNRGALAAARLPFFQAMSELFASLTGHAVVNQEQEAQEERIGQGDAEASTSTADGGTKEPNTEQLSPFENWALRMITDLQRRVTRLEAAPAVSKE